MKLFLDDERMLYDVKWLKLPGENWDWDIVRNYREFVDYVETNGLPETVSFDHDLADFHYEVMMKEMNHFTAVNEGHDGALPLKFNYGPEKTGYDCAKWLVDYCVDNGFAFPEYYVHSLNPIGSKRIKDYIEWAKTQVNSL